MDFSRLVGGQDQSLNRQLAEQLLSNAMFRDAAIKASKESTSQNDTQNESESASGLDNLLGQLSAALSQAALAAEQDDAPAGGEAGDGGQAVTSLLSHPAIQEALGALDLETSLSVKVLLGQVPPAVAQRAVDLLTRLPADTVAKVKSVLGSLDNETLDKGINFFSAMFSDRNDRVFAQQDNGDNYLNSSNSQLISGADLNKFLQTAYYVLSRGYDVGKYLDHATKVMNEGDYDDFRRFLDVTDMMNYKGQDLDTFFEFGNRVLDEAPSEYEGAMFQAYMAVLYGGKVEDYIDIHDNLGEGFEGRNDSVDLTRIVVDFYKAGGYTPMLYKTLADEARAGGSVRAMMDEYMDIRGLEDKSPDFELFDRIERIDTGIMRIKQGESAAVFAQAVSSRDGLLDESVLFWSSLETGAMGHGSSYLDLSKLGPGTYHIACKIGNYPGTDTAFKTVIIEPADATEQPTTPPPPQIILPEDGQVKITVEHGSAALRSDLFMKLNLGNLELVAENAQQGANVTVQRPFKAGDKLDFAIKTFSQNGSTYHSTEDGSYCKITQTGPNTWQIGFEDLEDEASDGDFNDVVVTIELLRLAEELENGGAPVGGGSSAEAEAAAAQAAAEAAAAQAAAEAAAAQAAAEAAAAQAAAEAAAAQAAAEAAAEAEARKPLSYQEALDLTKTAIGKIGTEGPGAAAAILNEKYYASLDLIVEGNQNYAQMVDDVRGDAAALKRTLNNFVRMLNGAIATNTNPYA